MWFKQLFIYQFEASLQLTASQIEDALQQKPWRACGAQELSTWGFRSLVKNHDMLSYVSNEHIYFKLTKQERILPNSVINEQLQEKIDLIRQKESREVGRKERTRLKEDIQIQLLPKAFTKNTDFLGVFSLKDRRLILNCSSEKNADDITAILRQSLGSLAIKPWQSMMDVKQRLTQWIDQRPNEFELLEEFELSGQADNSIKVKLKNLPLHIEQTNEFINDGLILSQLRVQWREKMELTIKDDATVKRIKFLDTINDDSDYMDEDSKFATECLLHATEINLLLNDLSDVFIMESAV